MFSYKNIECYLYDRSGLIMIELLRTFLSIVDRGGVTQAASALHMSQAAASQQVKRLEERLDCRLFERQGRGLVLAPAGERLEAQARRLVAQADELLSSMRAAQFDGEVRFGVPYDIIASFVPSILRRYARAQPKVRVSLVCEDSKVVRRQLAAGDVDLALTTESECGRYGETLRTDRLVWVGVPGGDAHLKDPLPVSLGAPTCVFRPVALEALGRAQRDWRAVCEVSRMEPVYAAIEAGLAVAPLLRSSVPERFEILGRHARLPALPEFRINLYAPPGIGPAARDLAEHVRSHFSGPRRRAADN
jgi:DNA-binding transcriptional LysR family regulator